MLRVSFLVNTLPWQWCQGIYSTAHVHIATSYESTVMAFELCHLNLLLDLLCLVKNLKRKLTNAQRV